MLIDSSPAISIVSPTTWTCAVAVTSFVTPWIVSLPRRVTSAGVMATLPGTDALVAVNVANGICCISSCRATMPSRWLTLRPATWSTLCRLVRSAVRVMPLIW